MKLALLILALSCTTSLAHADAQADAMNAAKDAADKAQTSAAAADAALKSDNTPTGDKIETPPPQSPAPADAAKAKANSTAAGAAKTPVAEAAAKPLPQPKGEEDDQIMDILYKNSSDGCADSANCTMKIKSLECHKDPSEVECNWTGASGPLVGSDAQELVDLLYVKKLHHPRTKKRMGAKIYDYPTVQIRCGQSLTPAANGGSGGAHANCTAHIIKR